MTTAAPHEGRLLTVLALAQFVAIIDYMMIMPLGPDFAAALSIDIGHLGWIGGIYTLASAFTGILVAVYLDRFDRKKVFLISLGGLAVCTGLSGFAWNFESLLVTRFLSGIFGGPGTAICYAIIADAIPAHRRGAAMGKVLGALSFASILGVPFGLELAQEYGWNMPFFASSLSVFCVFLLGFWMISPMTGHMAPVADIKGFSALKKMLYSKVNMMVFLFAGMGSFSSLLITPNLAGYVQHNLGFPREQLGLMYMIAGVVSFFVLRVAGRIIDRTQASVAAVLCCVMLVPQFYFGFISPVYQLPVMAIYILFMSGMALRSVSNNALASRIPEPSQRAGFLALMASIAQIFAAGGAFISSILLTSAPDGRLVGFEHVAWLAILATLAVPAMMWWVERRVILREKAAKIITPPEITL